MTQYNISSIHCSWSLWGSTQLFFLFFSAPSFPAALLMRKVHLRSPWRNIPGDCSTTEGPQVQFVLNITIFLYQTMAPVCNYSIGFTSSVNHPLQGKLAISFCEINTLISCMVTANTNVRKWTSKWESLCISLFSKSKNNYLTEEVICTQDYVQFLVKMTFK